MAQPLPTRDPIKELDRSMPAAAHIKLGKTINDIITSINGILAQMDETGSIVNATGTVTVGGSITAGDTVTLTFTNPRLPLLASGVSVAYPVVGGDTTSSIAAALSAAVNLSAPLVAENISSTATAAVVFPVHAGSIGNATVMTKAVSGAATETVTLTNSGTLAGGLGTEGSTNVAKFGLLTLAQRVVG